MDEVPDKPSDLGAIPPLDPSKTPKQIYFELLRTWVQHAQMQQQIQAYFPYYLMNNYPQLFQPAAGAPGTNGQPVAGNGVVANATGSQVQAQPNANQRRGAELLDPARQEESELFWLVFFQIKIGLINCSYQSQWRLRVHYSTPMEAFRGGGNRYRDHFPSQSYDDDGIYRLFRYRFVSGRCLVLVRTLD